MTDILARAGNDFQGSFAADAARVVFASNQPGANANFLGVGLITQQIGIQYAQSLSRIYEIGTNYTYVVVGRTQGQLTMQRVLGPRPIQLAFYTKYGNACNMASNNLNFEADTGCPQGDSPTVNPGAQGGLVGTYKFGIHNAVITNLSIGIQSAEQMVINETVNMMYIGLTGGQLAS